MLLYSCVVPWYGHIRKGSSSMLNLCSFLLFIVLLASICLFSKPLLSVVSSKPIKQGCRVCRVSVGFLGFFGDFDKKNHTVLSISRILLSMRHAVKENEGKKGQKWPFFRRMHIAFSISYSKKLFIKSQPEREISPVSSVTYAVYSSRALVVRQSRFALLAILRPQLAILP